MHMGVLALAKFAFFSQGAISHLQLKDDSKSARANKPCESQQKFYAML